MKQYITLFLFLVGVVVLWGAAIPMLFNYAGWVGLFIIILIVFVMPIAIWWLFVPREIK